MRHTRTLKTIALVALLSVNTYAAKNDEASATLPNGKPFQIIEDRFSTIENTLNEMIGKVDSLEGVLEAQQSVLSTLQDEITEFQVQIDSNDGDIEALNAQVAQNQSMIVNLEAEIERTNEAVKQKQNIINGVCPDGESVQSINEDGSLVCSVNSTVGTNRERVVVRRIYNTYNYYTGRVSSTAVCPNETNLITGGYSRFSSGTASGSGDSMVTDNKPSGNAWTVHVKPGFYRQYFLGGSYTYRRTYEQITAYAICEK